MATLPYFVLGPSSVLSTLGLVRGGDPTTPTPAEDWRTAKIDVIIPALNEEETIALALASLLRQSVRPRRIILVDDGSTDRTVEVATAFCSAHGLNLTAIRRRKPIGKTPTIKRQALELDSDVEFILDADTVLESPTYIERTVQELYKATGIASACGTILPLTRKLRAHWNALPEAQESRRRYPQAQVPARRQWTVNAARGVTNLYREVLYLFLQRFVYRGQMVFFGTTSNPVGCAVAYRRKYVQRLFEHFTPILGDDLTNSEDIFIGLALLNEGYRNIQLTDVYARTVEPQIHRLPRQVYLWSSAFLQSCYYFDPLVKSPLRMIKRFLTGPRRQNVATAVAVKKPMAAAWAAPAAEPAYSATSQGQVAVAGAPHFGNMSVRVASPRAPWVSDDATNPAAAVRPDEKRGSERRRIREPYRQAFGRQRTLELGRPAGWILMLSAVEKVFFPTTLLIMAILGNWHGLAMTVVFESIIGILVLGVIMKGRRLEYMAKGLAVAPIRYALMTSELFTLGRFATDMWLTKNRNWRK